MPRIRSVKPEFWTDGRMVALSRDARLFYIGLWNFALCDQGHLEDDPVQLKLKVFPADAIDVVALIDELLNAGRLVRLGTPDGRRYLHIVHLSTHQKVDPRWSTRCPACNDAPSLTETPRHSPELTLGGDRSGWDGMGSDGSGEKTPSPATPLTVPDPDGFDRFYRQYPRKVGKDAARKAYTKALKRATAAQILLGARRYALDPNLPDKQFIPHPSTWLNEGRWDDEPQPPRTSGHPTTDDRVRAGLAIAEQLRQAATPQTFPQIGA